MKSFSGNVDLFAVAAIVLALGAGSLARRLPAAATGGNVDRVVRIERTLLDKKLQEAERRAQRLHRRFRLISCERP